MNSLSLVVLISGNGSNLQAIIDAIAAGKLSAKICAVISNRADAYGLERAQKANIPTQIITKEEYKNPHDYDAALQKIIEKYQSQLIVLAGFMRILTPDFVKHYHGRIINIHPSLLPKYRGLNTHRRVLEAKELEHGVTIHFVTEELDGGPTIVQEKIPVHAGDSEETLQKRIHQVEHRLYPEVIKWFAEGKLKLVDDKVWLDGKAME